MWQETRMGDFETQKGIGADIQIEALYLISQDLDDFVFFFFGKRNTTGLYVIM